MTTLSAAPRQAPRGRSARSLLIRAVLGRIGQFLLALFVIASVVFFIVRSSGNVVNALVPPDATDEQRRAIAKSLHLDEPLIQQYGRFLLGLLHGDLGISNTYQRPTLAVVAERLPATLLLAAAAVSIAIVVGLGLGICSALREGAVIDRIVTSGSVITQAMPSFWLGIMLVLVFSIRLHILPTSGSGSIQHLILPSVTLAAFITPQILLITRSSMVQVLHNPYIQFARAKGMKARTVTWRHALRNALPPILASVGVQFGPLLGGAVITEQVFAWPGLGRLSLAAILSSDVPLVITCVLILATSVLLSNLIVDLINRLIDPRGKDST